MPRPPPQIKHNEPPSVKEASPSENISFAIKPSHKKFYSFFILHPWRRIMEFSIFREWALRLSRRACHVPILRRLRMGRKRCDNPYYCNVDFVLFHNDACYTNSLLSRIQVNPIDLLNIMCTLVATCLTLRT